MRGGLSRVIQVPLHTPDTGSPIVKGLNITPAPEWAVVEQDLRSLTVLAEKVHHLQGYSPSPSLTSLLVLMT